MSLEQVLKELEQGKGPVRDPERYFLTIFGTPSDQRQVGLAGRGAPPLAQFHARRRQDRRRHSRFFGSNPAEVRQGPRQGLRTLADREDTALAAGAGARRQPEEDRHRLARSPQGDPRRRHAPAAHRRAPGIAYADLNSDQRALLRALVESYASDMPDEVAKAWLDEIRQAGPDGIKFSWTGPADRTQGHAYRVQGPTFLIEFNNTQNGANHIHSVWRNMLGDFGIPLAAK